MNAVSAHDAYLMYIVLNIIEKHFEKQMQQFLLPTKLVLKMTEGYKNYWYAFCYKMYFWHLQLTATLCFLQTYTYTCTHRTKP